LLMEICLHWLVLLLRKVCLVLNVNIKLFLGDNEIEGLTDKIVPRRLGPKRATKIRRLFNLSKEDDVRKYVIRRTIPGKEGFFVNYTI
jgi:hypothetical protein